MFVAVEPKPQPDTDPNWLVPDPNWLVPDPNWLVPDPNWLVPDPNWLVPVGTSSARVS